MPVMAQSFSSRVTSSSSQPWISRAGAPGCTELSPGIGGDRVTELRVVLHRARPSGYAPRSTENWRCERRVKCATRSRSDTSATSTTSAVQVAAGHELVERRRGHAGGAQLEGRATGHRHLEDRRLGLVTEQRGRRGASAGKGASASSRRPPFEECRRSGRARRCVRRSVTVTSRTSSMSSSIDGSVAPRQGRDARARRARPHRPWTRAPPSAAPGTRTRELAEERLGRDGRRRRRSRRARRSR